MEKKRTFIARFRRILRVPALFGAVLACGIAFIPAASVFADSQTTANVSQNWSGYIADTGTYTSVSGSWAVPQVALTPVPAADATWVGIGGLQSADLIQAGTQAIVEGGKVSYQAWYELLPQASVTIPVSINSGDAVNASITQQSAGQWTISFTDISNGQTYHQQVSYQSSLSSAEWIEEMPQVYLNGTTNENFDLDQFGTIHFSNATAVENGIAVNLQQANVQLMAMVNGNDQVLAVPSAIGTDEASFSIARSSNVDATSGGTTEVNVNPSSIGRNWRVGVGIRGFGRGQQYATSSPTQPSGQPQYQYAPQSQSSQTQQAGQQGGQSSVTRIRIQQIIQSQQPRFIRAYQQFSGSGRVFHIDFIY